MIGSQHSSPAMEFRCSEIEALSEMGGLVEGRQDWNSVGANAPDGFRSLCQSPTHRKLTEIGEALGCDSEIENIDVVRVSGVVSDRRDRPGIDLAVIEF